jgi:uncharacterized cupredoxin-like copper-binding protein
MKIFPLAAAVLAASPGTGTPVGSPVAPPAEVIRLDLSNFRIAPRKLTLVHGHPYVLELVNRSSNGHDFTARRLLGSSRVAGAAPAGLVKGAIDVPERTRVRVAIVPQQPGRFEFHCSHRLHAVLGMRGWIDVL